MLGDARHALRLMWQAKGWTAVVLLSLALGIGANTALFSVVNGLLLKSVPVRDPRSLVRLRWSGPNDVVTNHSEYGATAADPSGDHPSVAFSYPMFRQLAESNHTLGDLVACAPFGRVNVIADGEAEIARAFISSGNYYRALGVAPSLGRLFDENDDRPTAPAVAVISSRYWRTRFGGDRRIIGKVLRVNDVPVTVIGVVPPEFTGIQQPIAEPHDLSLPLALEGRLRGVPAAPAGSGGSSTAALVSVASSLGDPTNWWLEVVGRVKPGVTATQVQANLGPAFEQTARANLDAYLSSLSPEDRSRSDNQSRTSIPRLRVEPGARGVYDPDESRLRSAAMLVAVAGIVLLIVCANVANLLLARAATRHRDIAIRLSIGASRLRIVRQMLTESLVLACAGGLLGVLVGAWARRLVPDTLGQPGPIDGRVLAFTIVVVGATGLAFGLAPALTATRVTLSETLNEQGRGVVGSRRLLSKALLVAQVALALVLLVGAALFVRTVRNLRDVDVGFNPNNLLLFTINPQLNHYEPARVMALYRDLLDRLRAVPGVRDAALSQPALLAGSTNVGGVFIEGKTYVRGRASGDRMNRVVVSPDFFQTMQMPIARAGD